ncbi:acyl-CoA carboxylase epsilon subunit [Galactobacter valiniphilus]|uniref:Acyl-CoA carboxylase subunit epsilon n=1 Tax=Galactobacter valiniphilus TaxID=2676122 RepID=A0A399J8V1_9MICC|nr:acyl-CoA carboxylase epsilon subunit [Galactobacter valiniphilus]RII41948.1 acyl-CoA carboxylase subunit epsilon [Galactobacter valiniphilus]
MSAARRPWAEPDEASSSEDVPFLRVVRGEPTPEELAAVTAVLVAAAASASHEDEEPKEATRSDVLRRSARLRSRLMAVPGAWRARGR